MAKSPGRGRAGGRSGGEAAEALATAVQLSSTGRLAEAEAVCRQVVDRWADPEAYNFLGVLVSLRGEAGEGARLIGHAIDLSPGNAGYHANLGELERQRGRFTEAERAVSKAIEIDPASASAWSILGAANLDQGKLAEGAAAYERAVALQPEHPEAHNDLGNAYRALGRRQDAEACYRRAIELSPLFPEAHNNLAIVLGDADDFDAAERSFRQAIALNPGAVDVYNNLASLLLDRDRPDEALQAAGAALRLNQRHLGALLGLGKAHLKLGACDFAERAARLALQIEPDNVEALRLLAEIYHELDRYDDAVGFIARALQINPKAADVRSFHGVVLKSLGRLDEAQAELRKTLELDPKLFGAYANLSDLESFKADSELIASMQAILANAPNARNERYIPVYFALGKALEQVGAYDEALQHFAIGAGLRRAQLSYDEADAFRFFDQIKAAFPPGARDDRQWLGNPSPAPVFIVGMQRSGSTLVEQILASHPQVHGAGEIKTLNRSLHALRAARPDLPPYPDMIGALGAADFEQLAGSYLQELLRRAGPAERVTDKLLTNYIYVGLIHRLFPQAKIIHTRRNPIDNCISAYTTLFRDGAAYTYDLGELARYYRRYDDLMRHWAQVLPPGVLMTVDYESVIADVEGAARSLVAHVGLAWDDACLEFYKLARPVRTASVAQVRKPIYATSVERWRRYADRLAPLLEALAEPRGD